MSHTAGTDLVGPLPQVLRAGFGPFGIAGPLVTIAILMTLATRVAQASVSFTAVTMLALGRRRRSSCCSTRAEYSTR